MARTSANQNEPSDDKKDTTTKKKISRKKNNVTTGVWPCKINGCNKQFAREADLKRHQRTTKLHSMPNFPCPQCDATFTRTDALRRHQKSRHQGVVLGPAEKDGDDDGSSGSQSKSRSATPSLKGKEKANDPASHSFPNSTRNGSSYYRQHTLTTGPYVPPRQIAMNTQYTNVDLPTSAPRSNADAPWGYPNPWPDGVSIHQMSYQHVYYTSHYRTNVSSEESVPISPSTAPRSNSAAQHPTTIPPPPHSSQNIHKNSTTNPDNNSENATTNMTYDDSHPSHSNESTDLTAEQILQLTKITKAFFDDRECPSTKGRVRSTSTINGQDEREIDKSDHHHSHGHLLERAQSMEHMLTEDGEPMLNPAELLTQESLASPPPS